MAMKKKINLYEEIIFMHKYLIENAKCGVTDGGLACGPVGGAVNVSVKYRCGNESNWLSVSEFDGIPTFFETQNNIFDILMNEDENELSELENSMIDEINGINLMCEYEDIFDSVYDNSDNPAVNLLRYIIAITRCESKKTEEIIGMACGKYVDEINIPISDVETEYIQKHNIKENNYTRRNHKE